MNNSFHLKLFSLFLFLLLFGIQTKAQHDGHDHGHVHHEKDMRRIQVAKMDQGQLKDIQMKETETKIPSKVKSAIRDKVNPKEVLVNTSSLEYFDNLGWYVTAELNLDGQQGMFREKLQSKNNELFLTEHTEGDVCLISNCKKVVFVKSPMPCKCEQIDRVGEEVKVTHRMFTHIAN